MSVLVSALAFLVAIMLLVTVHELGHFRMARLLKIRALRFAFGWGTPVWSRMGADGVEYAIGPFPVGGYVMFDDRDAAPTDLKPGETTFHQAPRWKRALVLLAGPAANLVLAVLLYWAILVLGVPGVRPIVDAPPANTAAAAAGLAREDELVKVGEREVATWEGASIALLDAVLAGDPEVRIEVRAPDGGRRQLALALADPRGLTEPGALLKTLGLEPFQVPIAPVLGLVGEGGPLARAGLKVGDRITHIDGVAVADWREVVVQVRDRPGRTVPFRFVRQGEALESEVALLATEQGGRRIGRMEGAPDIPAGLFDRLRAEQRYGAFEAVPQAFARTADLCTLTLRMIWRMLTGGASLSNISGPINIAQYAGVTASISMVAFLGFLAVISVSLGVLNLLPVPLLDGGQLTFLGAEAVLGRPLPEAVEARSQQVGILLLLCLMCLAFYNDIARLL